MFIKCLKVGQIPTNCYIACDKVENRAVIIDPGADASRIVAALEETECIADYVIFTHGHADHTMAAHEVMQKTGAKLAVFADELPFINDSERNCYNMMAQSPFEPFTPDLMLRDGETLSFGNTELRAMHTPGHTSGSCCFLSQDMMFSGDTLFREGVGRTDLPTGNIKELYASLKRIAALEGDFQILPGHGEFTTLEYERGHNPYLCEQQPGGPTLEEPQLEEPN
jgi:glyoxylase-like metal-dependent hydrolase (beta-lactamase superfamily II)